jgi:hypothetical protein
MAGREFTLELDRPRKLKFGFRAMRLIKEKLGDKDLADIENMAADEMPTIAWAGMSTDDPALKVEDVEGLLDDAIPERYTLTGIITILTDALLEHMVGKPVGGSKKSGGGSGDKRSASGSTKAGTPPSA